MDNSDIFRTQTSSSVETTKASNLLLYLIGPMKALAADGASIPLLGHRAHAILAVLALSPRPVSRLALTRLLWSGRGEDQQRASLRQEIHRLHAALASSGIDALQITREHLELHRSCVWTDVAQVLNATADEHASLTLLTGPLLEDFDGLDPAFDKWMVGERDKLISHARLIAEAILAQQVTPDRVLEAARQLLAIDPVHEKAWLKMIRTHNEMGNRSIAIQIYQQCRAVLAEIIEAVPCQEIEQLIKTIRAG